MNKGRILGLDPGDVRVGVAVSDELCIVATARYVLDAKPESALIEKIVKIVEEEEIKGVVVGFPLHMNGGKGEKAEEAAKFAENLAAELDCPVILRDERLTTVQAVRISREMGKPFKKAKDDIDAFAAKLILQEFMDAGCPGL